MARVYRIMCRQFLLPLADLVTGTRIVPYRKLLERTQWLEREEILRLQERRLRELLEYVFRNVPHYHRVLKERGLRPSDFKTAEDLSKLPILRKRDITAMPHQFISKYFPEGEMIPCQTSGTTAVPLMFFRTRQDISWSEAAKLRVRSWGGYEFGDKHELIAALQPHEVNTSFRLASFFGRRDVSLNVDRLSEDSVGLLVHRMEELRPDFVMGYAACIHLVATYIVAKGVPLRLKAIFTTSETLLPSQRRLIERAFGCEVYDEYGCREAGPMACECAEHSAYHVQSENVVVEFVRNCEQVAPGETGAILVTNLHNYAMPLIRYDIGDTGRPSDDACPCGRGLPLIKSLEGRRYEYLLTGDGSIMYLKDLDMFFENLPVRMFQVVQNSRDRILIKIVRSYGYSEKDTEFIERNITWGSPKAKVEVELVDSIPLEKSAKRRYIVNKMPLYSWFEQATNSKRIE